MPDYLARFLAPPPHLLFALTFWVSLLAVLGDVFDRRDDRLVAEAAGVDQVALLAAEEGEAEVADRGVGDDRDDGLQGAL